jgi:hypothetical protein
LRSAAQQRFVPAYWSAIIHAEMHNKDDAFQLLETAYRAHESWMVLTKAHPWLDNLRSDPRFQGLLHRMNFPS